MIVCCCVDPMACNLFLLSRIYALWRCGMELSLIGAFIVLFLCNPALLVHTYDFWACFGGVCIYFAVVAIIYEAVLSFLFCAVPVCIHHLCQARLDAKLPLRVGLCLVMLFCSVWHVASLSVPIGHMVLYWYCTQLFLCILATYSTWLIFFYVTLSFCFFLNLLLLKLYFVAIDFSTVVPFYTYFV